MKTWSTNYNFWKLGLISHFSRYFENKLWEFSNLLTELTPLKISQTNIIYVGPMVFGLWVNKTEFGKIQTTPKCLRIDWSMLMFDLTRYLGIWHFCIWFILIDSIWFFFFFSKISFHHINLKFLICFSYSWKCQ